MMGWKSTVATALAGVLIASQQRGLVQAEVYLGDLGGGKSKDMGVSGFVYAISERVLEVRSFTYNGEAPDALFWADVSAEPSDNGTVLLAASHNCSNVKLDAFTGNETVRVEFPEGSSIMDVRNGSISVWCRAMKVNVGNIVVPPSIAKEELEEDSPIVCFPQELTLIDALVSRAKVASDVITWLIGGLLGGNN